MEKLISSASRLVLVAATVVISIVSSQLIVFSLYKVLDVTVRKSEVILCVVAPLLIAWGVTWYLYGVIKKLKSLEEQLRNSITKEKEDVYLATIYGAQHIVNNLIHGLLLIGMEIDKHPDFDQKRKRQFLALVEDSNELMTKLSSADVIEADKIRSLTAPYER